MPPTPAACSMFSLPIATMPIQLRPLVPALFFLAVVAAAHLAAAQRAPDSTRAFVPFASAGPSQASRLPDGPGVHLDLGVIHPLGHGFSVRLEGTRHVYGAVAVAPCLIQDDVHCYQTLDRRVTAGMLDIGYDQPITRGSIYLIAGAGMYASRRLATRYPTCEVAGPCDNSTYQLAIRATQPGVNGGVGATMPLGIATLFADVRLHFVKRTSPGGGPSNDYFLFPLAVGLRL